MKPIIIHSEAEAEMNEGAVYYEHERQGRGVRFLLAVKALSRRIRRNPKAFSPWRKQGVRKAVVPRFPYSVFFVEYDEYIWVAAVAHGKRRPGYWIRRKPELE